MSNEQEIEQRIQDEGLNAPRLNPVHIDAQIVSEQFHVFEPSKVTVCLLTLSNGFTTLGYAGVVSPENYHEQIGQDIARKNARDKIWQLEGYLLKARIYEAEKNQAPKPEDPKPVEQPDEPVKPEDFGALADEKAEEEKSEG